MAKTYRKSRIWRLTLALGMVILGVQLWWQNFQLTTLEVTAPIEVSTMTARAELPDRVVIPSVKIDQLLKTSSISNGQWHVASQSASYLANSARPGENSNIVIYGHNYKNIFTNLKHVKVGDSVEIYSEHQITTYRVTTRKIVAPTAIEIALPTAKETLTLYTCIGLLDSQRLVLTAEPENIRYRTQQASNS
jgi:LPXTG-site transpeptidase (sortase) family protein